MNHLQELAELTERFLREIITTVTFLAQESKGKKISGLVKGRPSTEDREIEADRICEEVFRRLLSEHQLQVKVFSEHGIYGKETPDFLCAIDPLDGSGLFRRGIEAEWYSVLTFFDLQGVPLIGGTADILRKRIYLAESGKITRLSLEEGTKTIVSLPRKRVLDNKTRLAGYLMSPHYLIPWAKKMENLLKKFPGLFIWPNGGSCIYHLIAGGEIHAYIMFDEPRSEIDPGLAFAKAAGYPTVSVKDDGTYEYYKFLPDEQAKRIPFFIAACTEKLIKTILKQMSS